MEEFEKTKNKERLPLECNMCNITFTRIKKNLFSAIGRKNNFCSKKCSIKFNTKSVSMPCGMCNKIVVRVNAEIKKSKSGYAFCSHSCSVTYSNQHKTTGSRRSKLETKLEEQLRVTFDFLDIVCNGSSMIGNELDFYFPALKLAFEINGIFHYEPIFGQDKLNSTKINDQNKIDECLKQNIDLHVINVYNHKIPDEKIIENCITVIQNAIDNAKTKNIDVNSIDPLRGAKEITKVEQKIPFSLLSKKILMEKAICYKRIIETNECTFQELCKKENQFKSRVSAILKLNQLSTNRQYELINCIDTKMSFDDLLKEARNNK